MSDESIYSQESISESNSTSIGTVSSNESIIGDQLITSNLYDKDEAKDAQSGTETLETIYDTPKIIKVKQYRLYKRNING